MFRVVLWQGLEGYLRLAACEADDHFGQFQHSELTGVADVDGTHEIILRGHHPYHTLHEVIDILETAGLLSVTIDGDVLSLQRTHHEVRHHSAVVGLHLGAVGVEDAYELDAHTVQTVVVHGQRLRATLSLIVA